MWPTRPLLLLPAIVLLVLPLLTLASCASRAPRPESDALRTQRELAVANASFQRACYVCLRDAMTSADAVLAREPEHREARTIAFRAAVLAAVRERQLGIQDTVAPSPQPLQAAASLT